MERKGQTETERWEEKGVGKKMMKGGRAGGGGGE